MGPGVSPSDNFTEMYILFDELYYTFCVRQEYFCLAGNAYFSVGALKHLQNGTEFKKGLQFDQEMVFKASIFLVISIISTNDIYSMTFSQDCRVSAGSNTRR